MNIFFAHTSDVLTDHLPNGDGLIAHGFLQHLAARGHTLHVMAARVELRQPPAPNVHITLITPRLKPEPLARIEYMIRMRLHFNRLARTTHFDLIHQLNPVFAGLSLALLGVRLPLVLGTFVARWPGEPQPPITSPIANLKHRLRRAANRIRERISQLQQSQADILLLATPAARNRLIDPAPLEAKIRWLGHGVDTAYFSPDPAAAFPLRLAAEQADPSIFFLANLAPRKGIFPLLEAFALVLRTLPAARLTIAGAGPSFLEAQARAAALGIAARVDFLGAIDRARVPELLRAHAVYTLPAFGEPYATSLLEAMSCGRPVVVTNAGGLPYMVPPDGGLTVPPGDARALADALLTLLQNPELRRTMGLANRRRALDRMTWAAIIQQLEQVYRELVPEAAAEEPATSLMAPAR